MARYHFDVEYFTRATVHDSDGAEYTDLASALAEAADSMKELTATAIRFEQQPTPKRIIVLDAKSIEIGSVGVFDILPEELLQRPGSR